MKRSVVAATLMVFCTLLFAGEPSKSKAASEGFEKLKSLVGKWKGTSPEGDFTLTYKLVSGGSTIMEINDSEKHKDGMITMYHLDGDKLMMTHYCSMGNQPRMRASALTKDGTLAFAFVDGSNMTKDDAHMHALRIRFKDSNHMIQEWTMRSARKDEMHVPFKMIRAN